MVNSAFPDGTPPVLELQQPCAPLREGALVAPLLRDGNMTARLARVGVARVSCVLACWLNS